MSILNKKVSIIVPVYNVEEYLPDCLNSLINQTYSDLEIILINDGSKDDSLKILNSFAEKDSRIKVFNNENHGVSYTRNFGIENSTGDYIAFVDSDDIISEKYIEVLVDLLEKNNADMSVCSYTCFTKEQPIFLNSDNNKVFTKDLETAFYTVTIGGIAGKLYKKNIIAANELKVDESIFVCEDLLFNIQYVAFCKSLAFNSSKLYGYRQRESSAVHTNVSYKWFTVLKSYKYLFNNCSGKSVYKYVVFNYLKFLYEAKYIIKTKKIKPNFEIDIWGEIKIAQKQRRLLTFKERIKLFICNHFFFVVEKRR